MVSLRRMFSFVLIVPLVISLLSPAWANPADDLRRAQEQQRQTQRQLEEIQRRKAETDRRHRRLTEELRQAEDQLYRLRNDLAYLEVQLTETEKQSQVTEAELKTVEERLDQRTQLLNTRVRVIHELGAVSLLQVLMNATDFRDFVTRFELLKNIVSKDVELFYQVRLARDEVAAKKAQLDDRRARIASYRNQTGEKKKEVEVAVDDVWGKKQAALRDLALLEQQEDQLQAISREWEAKIFELQARLSFKRVGKLAFQWPVRGPITSPYGMRWHPILNKYKGHNGLDVAAPTGRSILAAESGSVIYSGWIEGYGYTVILDHGDNVSTLYAHSSRLMVRQGQTVAKGAPIALVGSTGWSTGPHLHFEVRLKGVPQNPIEWLP